MIASVGMQDADVVNSVSPWIFTVAIVVTLITVFISCSKPGRVAAAISPVEAFRYNEPVDGIVLIQEYIESPESFITRVEFIGGQYFYSVQVDTSEGFELCPADACQIGDLFCPVGEEPKEQRAKFEIVENHDTELLEKYATFLRNSGIDVAGIEFIRNAKGEVFTYDVNTNTNYNSDAEAKEGKFAMLQLAKFLGEELEKVTKQAAKVQ